ncbi:hypothetical protein [Actinocatenispora rupis]|uniref:DinB superfamily protein n=1 Tax=Actinocatenispora rupis TaxID=519421 RepID=A0A8J3J382_9ACTN|nr:hypothetical protein [Actinocatenispora rupis]GID10771.1 hypothetical protein Aru02nite_16600 [Actinocatenispora rupis]
MTRYLTDDVPDDEVPETDDRDVTTLIPTAVDEVLATAETWLAWDGRPRYCDGNAWTPHKALRRVTDHLVDHLAEIECRLAGVATLPDRWHGRKLTLDSDAARFTEADLDEATSRLRRLALCYRARLATLPADVLDAPSDAWTLRQVVHHVANVTYYARMLGPLTP